MEKNRKQAASPTSAAPSQLTSVLRNLLRHDRRLGAMLAVATFLTLAILGAWMHPIEIPNYENDRYHLMAEQLLAGEWPRDLYRPMLYVLLTAAVGSVTGDCFVAAKFVSAMGGGLLVFATFTMTRHAFGRRAALAAAALIAVCPIAIRYSMLSGTDGLAVALSTMCLATVVGACSRRGLRPAILAGLAFAIAYWSRYQTVALLPIALLGVWLGAAPNERLRRLGAFGTAAFLGLIPHMTLSMLQFGRPFYDENWRNVALRHFSPNVDFTYLHNNPFDGLLSVLRHDPATVLHHAADEAHGMIHWGLRNLIVGPEGNPLLGGVIMSLVALAAVVGWIQRPRAVGLMLLAGCSNLGLVALTFFGWDRMLLPALPIMISLLAALLVVGIPRMATAARASSKRPRLAAAMPAVAGATLLWSAIPATEALAEAQPVRAIEIARDLIAEHGEEVGIISDYPFLKRHCGGRHMHTWLGPNPMATLAAAQVPTMEWGWVLACRNGMDDAAWNSLSSDKLPPWLQPAIEEPTVRLWRIVR